MPLSLSNAVFWIAVLACVVAQLGILRATRTPQSAPASTPARRPASRAEEFAWATLPAVGLLLVLVLTWRAVHARTTAAAPAVAPAAAPVAGSAA
jgi:heme/copper-type cytochrome/quinol oxidase subunit 2